MASAAQINEQELVEADAKFKKAMELRDSDLETAVELLGQVLEVRNKAYGTEAPECADTYLYYGQCLFEQAQAATDVMGDQMTRAVNQRARAMAAAEDTADAAAAAADGDADDAADNAEAAPADADAAAGEPDAAQAGSSKAADTATPAAAAAGETTADEPASTEEAAAPTGDVPEGDEEQAAAAEGDADAEEGSSSSEGEEDGEDIGDEEGAAGEGEEQGAPEVTGESDDMVLAWEMLELARLIYNNHGGAESHANKLADCHMYIADILAEQEKFEAAVEEYKTAQEMLARVEGGHNAHRRRAAELEFKKATSLQLLDAPAEALAAMQAAHALLTAQLADANSQLASKAGSSVPDVSGAVASAAFASILGGYTPPAAEAPAAGGGESAEEQEAKAAVAKLHQQVTDIKGALESIQERMEELKASVDEHVSMKEQLAKIFAAVAADDGAGSSGGAQPPAAGGQGEGQVETVGFGAAGSSKAAAGEVKDIGVIGKGKRVAPTPVEAPAAAPAPAPAAAAAAGTEAAAAAEGSRKRPLSDLSSSDQEPGTEGEAGAAADGAAAKAAAAAAAATADRDAAPKRAKA